MVHGGFDSEESMSICSQACKRSAIVALVLLVVVTLFPSFLSAQDAAPPKVEIFFGYQWLNPGGNVPQSPSNPVAFKLPSSPTGMGTSLSYNFTKYWALE